MHGLHIVHVKLIYLPGHSLDFRYVKLWFPLSTGNLLSQLKYPDLLLQPSNYVVASFHGRQPRSMRK